MIPSKMKINWQRSKKSKSSGMKDILKPIENEVRMKSDFNLKSPPKSHWILELHVQLSDHFGWTVLLLQWSHWVHNRTQYNQTPGINNFLFFFNFYTYLAFLKKKNSTKDKLVQPDNKVSIINALSIFSFRLFKNYSIYSGFYFQSSVWLRNYHGQLFLQHTHWKYRLEIQQTET